MQPQKKRQTFTKKDKQTLLDDYAKSQLSLQKFAAMSGVGVSTFERWRREASVDTNDNTTNCPLTSDDPDNLFFELTAPIEPPPVESQSNNTDPSESKTNDFAQHLNTIGHPITCVIAIPNGITITVEAIQADQLALIMRGLLS